MYELIININYKHFTYLFSVSEHEMCKMKLLIIEFRDFAKPAAFEKKAQILSPVDKGANAEVTSKHDWNNRRARGQSFCDRRSSRRDSARPSISPFTKGALHFVIPFHVPAICKFQDP